jgi:hypothetical protein
MFPGMRNATEVGCAARAVRAGKASKAVITGSAVLFLLLQAQCAGLDQILGSGLISPPKVTFLGANLVQAPSQLDMSAYYCPKLLKQQAGLGITADFICSKAFGRAPDASNMQLGFDLRFQVANPNKIPLPLAEILTALSIFPGATNQNLGAVCLRLCQPGDTNCFGGADQRGCQDAPGDIKGLKDFPQAVANMLIARGVGAAGGQPAGFSAPKVVAGSQLDVVARLAVTPEALLPALEQLARQSVNELKAGRKLSFEIPYNLEGTVFGDAGSLGRVAAGFGPVAGSWPLPAERLIP